MKVGRKADRVCNGEPDGALEVSMLRKIGMEQFLHMRYLKAFILIRVSVERNSISIKRLSYINFSIQLLQ